METKVYLILDQRYKKSDETYPICLRLLHKGSKTYINLGESVDKDFWDQESGRVMKGAKVFPSLSWVNEKIQGKKIDANKLIKALDDRNELDQMSLMELKKKLLNKSIEVSFSQYIDQLINDFKKNNHDGQASIYKDAKHLLINYGSGDKDYKFSDVNYKLLRQIENKYQPKRPGCKNGLAVRLRTIRAVWNRAINEKLVKPEGYPFKDYKIKSSKTHKTAISQQDLRNIKELDLPVDTHAWHGRNMFFFSFYTRGMNFTDIAKLKVRNLVNGRIVYVRSKTKKEISVKITDNINHLLNLYLDGKQADSYIFPVVTTAENISKQIEDYLSVVNHALKRWEKRLGINKSLSFNTARHSWATIGKQMYLPVSVISEGLGHADIETTQIYLDDFDNDTIDNANDLITF